MAVSTIGKAALVVLDLQVATASLPTTPHPLADVVDRSARLAGAFREAGLPVVWVTVVVGDAVSDLDAIAHDNSVQRIFPNLGEVGTTEEILVKV